MSEYNFPHPYLEDRGENAGRWMQEVILGEKTDKREFRLLHTYQIPMTSLLDTYELLLLELSDKEQELIKVKEEYNQREFEIVYLSDIDFKSLYGSTAEKVRKQHAANTLKPLLDSKNSLELSVNWIKNYLPFIRELIKIKKEESV